MKQLSLFLLEVIINILCVLRVVDWQTIGPNNTRGPGHWDGSTRENNAIGPTPTCSTWPDIYPIINDNDSR